MPDSASLRLRAERVIARVTARLPAPVRAEIDRLPILLLDRPVEGDDPDLLGIYESFEDDAVSESLGPLVLFLQNIYDECRYHRTSFEAEIELTFLHELGHHLGWDEDDLASRGLE